jgi:putative phage-type endonuclease
MYKQKSQQWHDQRNNYLTASTIASAIGVRGAKSRQDLLIEKVSYGKIGGFRGCEATHWGNKYEPVANGVYAYRNHVVIHGFGMITNPKYPILGISPDGILEDRMLEIKCPYSRVIDGKIKTEYYHQMQEQMTVCEYDLCDFLECRFAEQQESTFWDDFDLYDPKEKGIILSYYSYEDEDIAYLYSPIELCSSQTQMRAWLKQTLDDTSRVYLGQTFWSIAKYNCQHVKRDPYWIVIYYPVLKKFWEEVEYYRRVGIDRLLKQTQTPSEEEISANSNIPIITDFFPNKGKCLLDDDSPPDVFRTIKATKKTRCLL